MDTFAISSTRDPTQDGRLDWSVKLPPGVDATQAIEILPGLIIPYAWISAAEQPAEIPNGLELVGSSSFTGSVDLNFDNGDTATVLHSSPGVSLTELTFSAKRNGSVPEGITLDQLLPISLIMERTSAGTVRAAGSRDGVQVSFTLSYAPNSIQFPLLNLTLQASDTQTSVDPVDGSTILTFSTISRLSEVPIQTLGGTVSGQLDDGAALPTALFTAYADMQQDGQLNWEIANLPGPDAVGLYRPLLPAIALSAAWLTAQETPERLMDGREATGDGSFQATVRMQFPQGQTLILESTSSGLSPEQPDRAVFSIVVSGSYPAGDEFSIGPSLSTPLQQTGVGVLSGRQNLQEVSVSLTITYQPLTPQAVPATLLLLQLSPAEVDTTGLTATIKFSTVAQLMLVQLPTVSATTAAPSVAPTTAVAATTPTVPPTLAPTPSSTPTPPAQVERLIGTLDSLAVSATADPAQDGKLDWSVRLPPGVDATQALALLPGLAIPYAWISAAEQPTQLPDGLDLVGSSSFTGSVILTFDNGDMVMVLHSSPGVSPTELTFSAERNGSVPEGITLNQLLPISLIMERTSAGTVRAVGSRDGVQVSFTLSYAPNGIQFPLLNLTLQASDTQTSVDPVDDSMILTFSTTSQLSEVPIQTLGGTVSGQLDDSAALPTALFTAYADMQRDGQLNWEIADLPGTDAVGLYRPLLPAIALSAAWLTAQETPESLMDGREATGDGNFQATVRIQFPQGQMLILESTSSGLSPEQPDRAVFSIVVSGSYPAEEEFSIGRSLSTTLQQTDVGVLSGQQNLQGVSVSLTITYQPLTPQAVPATLLLLQLSPAEVDTTGLTATIKFSTVAQLMLVQLPTVSATTAAPSVAPTTAVAATTPTVPPTLAPTPSATPTPPAQVEHLIGTLDSLAVSATADPAQDGKLDWSVRLPPGVDATQALALLPGLAIPYAWISAAEQPTQLPDGLDLVGSSSFTGSVVLTFDNGDMVTVLHSSPGVTPTELTFSAERNGSVPEGITLDQLLPISLIMERTSAGTVRAVGSRDGVQVSFTLSYAPNGIQFPLLNLTLQASDTQTSVDPVDGSTILTFSTTSRLSVIAIQTVTGSVEGQLDDGAMLPGAFITALVSGEGDSQLNWNISNLRSLDAVNIYQPLLPAIVLSVAWLHADNNSEQLINGQEATKSGQFIASVHVQFPGGQILTVDTTSSGVSIEEPNVAAVDFFVSGNYPSEADLSSIQSLSLLLEQTEIGTISGRRTLSQGLHINLTISYIPLIPETFPRTLLSVQLSSAEVVATGSTFGIQFDSKSVLTLFQQPSATLSLLPSSTTADSSVSVVTSTTLPLPTPTPPDQEMLLRGTVSGAALPTVEIFASRDMQIGSRFEWIVRNFSTLEELDLYRPLLLFIPLSAALLTSGEQFNIITGDTKMNLTIVVVFSPGRTLRVETSSSVENGRQMFHQVEFSGYYPTISEIAPLFSVSLIMGQNERGYLTGEQTLQGGIKISIVGNYLASDFNPEQTFLLTAMTHSSEALGLSFAISSISMFKVTVGVLSSSVSSSIIPTSKATLSSRISRLSSVALISPRPSPLIPTVCKFLSFASLVAQLIGGKVNNKLLL